MREPSIHISKSIFIKILEKEGVKISKSKIDSIFTTARNYSLDHRSILKNNKKNQKILFRRTQSTVGNANMLADIIYSVRIKLKHVGVTKIKQTDNQWAQIRELVPIIDEFCSYYKFLNKRQGYIQFVEIGLNLMGNSNRPNYSYCANWMLQKASWISTYYGAIKEISEDNYKEETNEIYNCYINKILEMTGISNNYKKNPTDYVNFIHARKLADKIGVDYKIFMDSQFEALSFCNGIPKLEDLGNEKAQQRLTQFISKHGLIIRKKINLTQNDWDSFKK